ncbi:hypothetical protein CB0940_05195 [Cercospora beticola]|uniref:Uncharacterized protein n=1 Tax=Cercospora beticola TaxID=122368 RepID=A0A2G5HKY1_CERBT|nr:hypothetical protein CB0940_05195 [Cercospora beticola]PIA92872.1 hypothetical protein CB0940_05195 [Cercospora beticola]WPB02512.1 hypothetical protein RHO25_007148 [Cercospora beticola]
MSSGPRHRLRFQEFLRLLKRLLTALPTETVDAERYLDRHPHFEHCLNSRGILANPEGIESHARSSVNALPRFWFSRVGIIGMLGPVAKSLAPTLRHHTKLGKAEPSTAPRG